MQHNIFNVSKRLATSDQAEREKAAREQEVAAFDLVSPGGFLTYTKWALFALMGALNVRLFMSVVGGWWGIAISADAILSEGFALYCWHNVTRTSGRHRSVMLWSARIFTALSLLHALASFYEMIRAFAGWPFLGGPLHFYSHVIAFPLLFIGMIVAGAWLRSTHPAKAIAQQQADVQYEIQKNRAELLKETSRMRAESEGARAWLDHYSEKLKVESEFVELLRRVVTVEGEKAKLLAQIPEGASKRRMIELLGQDADQNGTLDILEDANLQQQFLKEWRDAKNA